MTQLVTVHAYRLLVPQPRHSTRLSLVTVVSAQTRNTVKVHVAVSIVYIRLLFVPTLRDPSL